MLVANIKIEKPLKYQRRLGLGKLELGLCQDMELFCVKKINFGYL